MSESHLFKFFNNNLSPQELKELERNIVEYKHLIKNTFKAITKSKQDDAIVSARLDDGCITLIFEDKEAAKKVEESTPSSFNFCDTEYRLSVKRQSNVLFFTAEEK